jgi:hypothetical protein
MKFGSIAFIALLALMQCAPAIMAQELDGSDINKELRERAEKINKLSLEEQLQLRAAEQKAAHDPAVQAALKKRNEAIQEFRAAIRASLLKDNPGLQPILDKIATGTGRGF